MHGELIEFNERLYRSLMAKDHLIIQMRQELIDLRGPVSGTQQQTHPVSSDFSAGFLLFSSLTRPLILFDFHFHLVLFVCPSLRSFFPTVGGVNNGYLLSHFLLVRFDFLRETFS